MVNKYFIACGNTFGFSFKNILFSKMTKNLSLIGHTSASTRKCLWISSHSKFLVHLSYSMDFLGFGIVVFGKIAVRCIVYFLLVGKI